MIIVQNVFQHLAMVSAQPSIINYASLCKKVSKMIFLALETNQPFAGYLDKLRSQEKVKKSEVWRSRNVWTSKKCMKKINGSFQSFEIFKVTVF